MTRFIAQDFNKPATTKKEKPAPKFGGKGGRSDYSKLADSKKVPTAGGYK